MACESIETVVVVWKKNVKWNDFFAAPGIEFKVNEKEKEK